MSTSEQDTHNETASRKVDDDAEHGETRRQTPGPGEASENAERDRRPGGAEGGESDAADAAPAAPADDSSPLGDTDQHSSGGA